MGLGLRRGRVIIEPHDDEWMILAQETIHRLKALLDGLMISAEHIGSTAIRGICAKPIIDIAVGISNFGAVPEMGRILEANGFIDRGEDHPGQHLFVCGTEDVRTHHIHVMIYGSAPWRDYVDMRDYLNSHWEDAAAYSALKASLAEWYADDRGTYTAMKGDMIDAILAKARRWREVEGAREDHETACQGIAQAAVDHLHCHDFTACRL